MKFFTPLLDLRYLSRAPPWFGEIMRHNTVWLFVVLALLLTAFCLGLPQFHYAVALMIALILRYKDQPYNEPLFKFSFSPRRS